MQGQRRKLCFRSIHHSETNIWGNHSSTVHSCWCKEHEAFGCGSKPRDPGCPRKMNKIKDVKLRVALVLELHVSTHKNQARKLGNSCPRAVPLCRPLGGAHLTCRVGSGSLLEHCAALRIHRLAHQEPSNGLLQIALKSRITSIQTLSAVFH